MTKGEYDLKKSELVDTFDHEISNLNKEFAITNSPYKIGDIIEDHFHIIKIESIERYASIGKYPSAVYDGVELTNKLVPKKNQNETRMYQINVKKKH